MLITFEGIDFSGKTTQVDILNKCLTSKGFECECLHFPDRSTRIGILIDKYLKKEIKMDDHVVHLLFSANRYELKEKIKHALANDKIVIIDRYNISGFVYSIANGLKPYWCKLTDKYLPKPDITILLHLAPVSTMRRHGRDDLQSKQCFERYDDVAFQEKVTSGFLKLKEYFQKKGIYKVINADRKIAEISSEIEKIVLGLIDLSKRKAKN